MPDQKTKTHATPRKEEAKPEKKGKALKNEKLDKDTEDLIDEIDAVLEENAEEFVKNYVQRGGE